MDSPQISRALVGGIRKGKRNEQQLPTIEFFFLFRLSISTAKQTSYSKVFANPLYNFHNVVLGIGDIKMIPKIIL